MGTRLYPNWEKGMNRKTIKRTGGNHGWRAKPFRLAKEVDSIQRRAAEHEGRFVTIGPLVFFSTQTGDAWMLDRSERLAARLAREEDPEPIDLQETETHFTIGWKGGHYRIDGGAFLYTDRASGRVVATLGYPTAKIARLG
jgi:hypothetical protein